MTTFYQVFKYEYSCFWYVNICEIYNIFAYSCHILHFLDKLMLYIFIYILMCMISVGFYFTTQDWALYAIVQEISCFEYIL